MLQEQGHPAAQAAPSAATAYEHASSTLQVSSVKRWCLDQCPGVQGFREENVMLPASCPLEVGPGECSSVYGTEMGSVGNVPFRFQK